MSKYSVVITAILDADDAKDVIEDIQTSTLGGKIIRINIEKERDE